MAMITKFQFRQRFTFLERVAITEESKKNAEVQTRLDDIFCGEMVDTALAEVIDGLDLFADLGLIAPGRPADILAEPAEKLDRREKRYDIRGISGKVVQWIEDNMRPPGTDYTIESEQVIEKGTPYLRESGYVITIGVLPAPAVEVK